MRFTDGGLATTLQGRGLPPHTPVEPWVLARPDEVRRAHRAFVDAGAEILLTATFRALPGVTDGWERIVEAAVALARAAAADRAEVWLSAGPGEGRVATVRQGLAAGIDGVVLETCIDPAAAERAVGEVRQLWSGPVVASLTPGDDGALLDGSEPGPWLDRLREAGASGVGFNCGLGPGAVAAAAHRVGPRGDLWLAPAGGDRGETLRVLGALRPLATWLGGCCGVGPELLAEAVRGGR